MNDEIEQYKNLPRGTVILLQATVGSTVHGTAVAGTDDRDEMAICIEPPQKVMGLHHFETMVYRTQPEGVRSGPGDLDLVVHTLRKFTRLAARGNPSILLPLYVPPSAFVGKPHHFGTELRKRRSMFLSKRVGKSFLGYLIAQKERLTGERGQKRVKRQELVDAYGFDCYLADTEFLTPTGWKTFSSIADGEQVATMNPVTERMEFQVPTARVAKRYSGPIHLFETRSTSMAITPNHRMWVSAAYRSPDQRSGDLYDEARARWQFLRAASLLDGARSTFHFRHACEPRAHEYPVTDAYLQLLGAYLSEGSVGKKRQDGTVSQLRVDQKVGGRLQPIMESLAGTFGARRYEYRRADRTGLFLVWTLVGAIAARVVSDAGQFSAHKHLPSWAFDLSTRQVNVLLEAMLAGDGTPHRSGGHVLYTNSSRLAGDVQAMCASAGIPSVVWGPYDAARMYHVRIPEKSDRVSPLRTNRSAHVEAAVGEEIVCFTVPNELLLTRRNGKVAIQGNTKYAGHVVRLAHQGIELMTTGHLSLPMQKKQADEVLAIRTGRLTLQQTLTRAGELERELRDSLDTDLLPEEPDEAAIDEFCVDTYLAMWMSGRTFT